MIDGAKHIVKLVADDDMNERVGIKSKDMFLVENAREIQVLLHRIIDHRCLFTAYFGDSQQFLLTSILGFSKDGAELLLDVSPNETINQRALGTPQLLLSGVLEQVEVRFRAGPLIKGREDGFPVLRTPVPVQMTYMQWRDQFRLTPPLSRPVFCEVRIPGALEDTEGAPIQMRVLDISGGGVALQVPLQHATDFPVEASLEYCRIDLPDTGVIHPEMKVRYTVQTLDNKRNPRIRIGCEFSNPPPPMQSLIQRYIMRTERERIAHSHGM